MITHLKPTSGAHVGAKNTVNQIMWKVILAISPATAFGILCFGWPALNLFMFTVCSAIFFEIFCVRWGRCSVSLRSWSSCLTTCDTKTAW